MNILLKNLKELVLDIIKLQSLLLSIQIICRMSIKILKSTTQTKNVKH